MSHIQLPQPRKNWVGRQRALDALYAALDSRLILVVAAAGYGKTGLLTQFAKTEGFTFSWLALSESERDLRVFGEGLVDSLKQHFPGFGAQTMQILASSPAIEQNVALLARTLVRDINAYLVQPVCIVLDDFHVVEASAPVIQFVDQLIAELPEEAHLIIASRNLPSLQLGVLIARQQVAAIGQSLLRLDVEETRQLIAAFHGLPVGEISDTVAANANAATEGWLVGLLMTNHIGRMRDAQIGLGVPRAVDLLGNYLMVQVLQGLPAPLQEFLCRSSVLDEISISFCNSELGWTDTAEWIVEVERRNLFIQTIGSPEANGASETTYRYHPLFREFLTQRLREDDPIRFAQVQREVSAAYERRGQIDNAIRHYLAGGWSEDVMRLMESHTPVLLQNGRHRTFLEWLDQLDAISPGARAKRHVLWQVKIWAHLNLGQDSQAMDALNQLDQLYLRTGDLARRDSLNIRRSLLLFRSGDFGKALTSANTVIHSVYPQQRWVQVEAQRIAAMCLFERGDLKQAFEAVTSAEEFTRDMGRAGFEALTRVKLTRSAVLDEMGDTLGALRAAAEAVTLAEQIQDDALRAETTIDLVERLLFNDSKEDLVEMAKRGLELGDATGNQTMRILGFRTLALVFMAQDKYDEAVQAGASALALARQITSPAERSVMLFTALIGQAHVLYSHALKEPSSEKRIGLLQQALNLSREATALAEDNQSSRFKLQAYARLGAVQARQGDKDLANAVFNAATAISGQYRNNSVGQVLLHRLLAAWAPATPDFDQVKMLLGQVRQIAEMRGQNYFLAMEGRQAWETYQQLRDAEDLQALKAAQLAQPQIESKEPMTPAAAPVKPQMTLVQHDLRVHGFGIGRVYRGNDLIPTSQWGWTIPRDLFFYILTLRQATRAQIGLVFWPESTASSMQSSFHNAKFAIKTALGVHAMVYVNGLYSVNPDLDYLYDVHSFNQLMTAARQVSSEDAIQKYLNAAALYSDDFLTDYTQEWAIQTRDALSMKFTECCLNAGAIALATNQPDAVINLLERAALRDTTNEEIGRLLMTAQWRSGKRRGAIETYARLKYALHNDMDLKPDTETEHLLLSIKANG
ncbi:MAG: hypothetical protein M1434_10445 [Chloroflexi bacterium]|nr:hypothetical protein [Chloroflexota bacterium]MCL5275145.1 hypothetical protein [Chloroflexota bacterium]